MKGASREGRSARGVEEEEKGVARSYHDTVLFIKLRHNVRQATGRDGGWCILMNEQCTKTGRPVAEVIWEKHPDMYAPPRGKFHVLSLRGVWGVAGKCTPGIHIE